MVKNVSRVLPALNRKEIKQKRKMSFQEKDIFFVFREIFMRIKRRKRDKIKKVKKLKKGVDKSENMLYNLAR